MYPSITADGDAVIPYLIDPVNLFAQEDSCTPFAIVPSWWSSFIFQILNGRQLSLYLYLSMLMGDRHVCHPTTFEIARDLGLSSSTMVFEAMNVLEENGFILRSRRTLPHLGSRRNIYQRPACEYTVIRLLRQKRIDGSLRPRPVTQPVAAEVEQLTIQGLRDLLGSRFAVYERAANVERDKVLLELLEEIHGERAGRRIPE